MSAHTSALPYGRTRVAAVAAAALVLLGLVAVAGRWERSRHASRENGRMAALFHEATEGGLVSPSLSGYRLAAAFDCLAYARAAGPHALELCFDSHGRLVETLDRRGVEVAVASLREQPSLAAVRVPVPDLIRAFRAAGALRPKAGLHGLNADSPTLPVGFADDGIHSRRH